MDFNNFWHRCLVENRQSEDGLFSHLTKLVFLHYLAKLETRKSHLFPSMLCSALQDFNQSLLDFFNLVDAQHIFMVMYSSLDLIINGVHLHAVEGGT